MKATYGSPKKEVVGNEVAERALIAVVDPIEDHHIVSA